jgi:hypothetical protein
MPFEVHMLQNNLNQEKVEVIVFTQPDATGNRILHVAQVNIQKLASGETGAQVRSMSFVFTTRDQAVGFQLAMLEAESVV